MILLQTRLRTIIRILLLAAPRYGGRLEALRDAARTWTFTLPKDRL